MGKVRIEFQFEWDDITHSKALWNFRNSIDAIRKFVEVDHYKDKTGGSFINLNTIDGQISVDRFKFIERDDAFGDFSLIVSECEFSEITNEINNYIEKYFKERDFGLASFHIYSLDGKNKNKKIFYYYHDKIFVENKDLMEIEEGEIAMELNFITIVI